MIKRLIFLIAVFTLSLASAGASRAAETGDGIFLTLETPRGPVEIELFFDKAPLAAANFIDAWSGPGKKASFVRVSPGLMVQADLTGETKAPSGLFKKEIDAGLLFDEPGRVAMLNRGDLSRRDKFLITLKQAPFLNHKHAVFGRVVHGLENLQQIGAGDQATAAGTRRVGRQARDFDLEKNLAALRATEIKDQTVIAPPPEQDRPKSPPPLRGKTDPARVPVPGQPETDKVSLEYIFITYRGAPGIPFTPYHDRDEALEIARRLAALAREDGADFRDLVERFSDSSDFQIRYLVRGKNTETAFDPVFSLGEGQISDPIETPRGFTIFRRVHLDLINVRHIFISHRDNGAGKTEGRTREEALALARELADRASRGEDFARLARDYSDSASAAQGGLIRELARGLALPSFEQAAFSLQPGEISAPTPTPGGFHIITRIE
ncbi:MAG: peptidylprolyl isomerase [Pseudomonadota bacterium]